MISWIVLLLNMAANGTPIRFTIGPKGDDQTPKGNHENSCSMTPPMASMNWDGVVGGVDLLCAQSISELFHTVI